MASSTATRPPCSSSPMRWRRCGRQEPAWRCRGRVLRRRRNRPYSAAWTGHLAGVPATLSPYWRCRPASCSAAPLPECVPTTSTIRGGLSLSCRWHQPEGPGAIPDNLSARDRDFLLGIVKSTGSGSRSGIGGGPSTGRCCSRIHLLSERSLLHLEVDVLEDLLDLLLGGVLAGPRWRSVPRRGGIDLDEAAGAVGLADWVEGADVVLERLLSM